MRPTNSGSPATPVGRLRRLSPLILLPSIADGDFESRVGTIVQAERQEDAEDAVWKRNGLSIVLVTMFLFTLAGQAVTGWKDHNQDELAHGRKAIPMSAYRQRAFPEATGENWESEFLEMASSSSSPPFFIRMAREIATHRGGGTAGPRAHDPGRPRRPGRCGAADGWSACKITTHSGWLS